MYSCTYLDKPSSISFLWAAYFSLTAWYSLLDCLKACSQIHTDLENTKQKEKFCTKLSSTVAEQGRSTLFFVAMESKITPTRGHITKYM